MVGIVRGSDEMPFLITRSLACLVAILLLLGTGTAMAEETKPGPGSDKTKAMVKIVGSKGRVDGNFSVFARASRKGGDKKKLWSGSNNSKKKLSDKNVMDALADCLNRTGQDVECVMGAPPTGGGLTGPVARAMAVGLVTELRLPTPKPIFGPDPNNNEWKVLAVGFPVWLRTDGPTAVSTSASSSGFTFRMTARWRSTTFHMGDGSTVTCSSMSKYSASVKPGTASPNCGHVYTKPSLPKGKYQVRAVADWDVSWSVAGFSGVLPAYNEASSSIPIGELVALNR